MKMAATSPGVADDVPSLVSIPIFEVGMGIGLLGMTWVLVGRVVTPSEVEGLGPVELLEPPACTYSVHTV